MATVRYSLCDFVISGNIAWSLWMRQGGQLETFWKCVSLCVDCRTECIDGVATPGGTYACQFRDAFVASFMQPHKKGDADNLATILHFLGTTNWDRRRIQVILPPGADPVLFKQDMKIRLPKALLPAAPSTFPKHRWTGADISLDETLAVAPHRLLEDCQRVMHRCHKSGRKPALNDFKLPDDYAEVDSDNDVGEASWLNSGSEHEDLPDGEGVWQANDVQAPDSNATSSNTCQKTGGTWAEFNNKNICKVGDWPNTRPVAKFAAL